MCRFRYAITEVDVKLLGALGEIMSNLKGSTEAVILRHLSTKYQDNRVLTVIPLQFLSSLMTQTIEFYDIDIERLTVVPKYQLAKKDCFSLRGPDEFNDVSHLLNAIDELCIRFDGHICAGARERQHSPIVMFWQRRRRIL